jgi:hypothetical protein
MTLVAGKVSVMKVLGLEIFVKHFAALHGFASVPGRKEFHGSKVHVVASGAVVLEVAQGVLNGCPCLGSGT